MKSKFQINHFGDCSIYALNCDICDCGEFRRVMPDIDKAPSILMEELVKHQCQIRDFAHMEDNKNIEAVYQKYNEVEDLDEEFLSLPVSRNVVCDLWKAIKADLKIAE